MKINKKNFLHNHYIFVFWVLFIYTSTKVNAQKRVVLPEKLWDKTLGGSDFEFLGRAIYTDDGNLLIGGASNSAISGDKTHNGNGSHYSYWLVKLDTQGNIIWDKGIGFSLR